MKNTPFIVDTETGCREMVKAIEKEVAEAYVPKWPWSPAYRIMKLLPLRSLKKMA